MTTDPDLIGYKEVGELTGLVSDPWKTIRNQRDRYLKENPGRTLEIVKINPLMALISKRDLLLYIEWRKEKGFTGPSPNFGTLSKKPGKAEIKTRTEWDAVIEEAYQIVREDVALKLAERAGADVNGRPPTEAELDVADGALALVKITDPHFPRVEPVRDWPSENHNN